eukprot:gene4040-20215_t
MKDPQTVTVKWKDTKDVMLISTMCPATPGPNDKIRKSQKESAEKVEGICPPAITVYRQFIGGVDTNDQMLAYYDISRKSYR